MNIKRCIPQIEAANDNISTHMPSVISLKYAVTVENPWRALKKSFPRMQNINEVVEK